MSSEMLRVIWWLLLGVLLSGFAIADGFDLGTAALLTFVGRSDVERRIAINSVGPVWEGNQVWFILGGGAIFAAWPALYAASFSGFYLAMFLVLAALIVRPVGFKFRSKLEDPRWRGWWDWALCIGGIVPPLVFGVAFGNLFEGVPFGFDADLRMQSDISLWSLLNPFALLCGLVSLAMILMHGATPTGAERIAACWARDHNVPQDPRKPDWGRHGRAAPFKRNDAMLETMPRGVIVFPGTGIQDNLADKARKLRIKVWDFRERRSQ